MILLLLIFSKMDTLLSIDNIFVSASPKIDKFCCVPAWQSFFFKKTIEIILRHFEGLRQVKKQQIKMKFWIWGPITV